MTATHQSNDAQPEGAVDWTARVAVRVPRDGGDSLADDARHRLERQRGVDRVEIVDLAGVEPALAATIAQFDCRVRTTASESPTAVAELLETASGVERVDDVSKQV